MKTEQELVPIKIHANRVREQLGQFNTNYVQQTPPVQKRVFGQADRCNGDARLAGK